APYLQSASSGVTFTQTNLVSDVPGMAKTTDSTLANPWGIAVGLNSAIWIANNKTGIAVSYDGKGQLVAPQMVIVPSAGNSPVTSTPTGVAMNDTSGFVISANEI